MGLLDKLRPLPRWKHADPAVRLEALRDLTDPLELATLAATDPDPKVRRAAVARTSDSVTLGRIASEDTDPEARDRAADRLLTLATAADSDETVALGAVRGLTDPRRLAMVAKSDAASSVRAEALARTTDDRALGGVARHARHEATAASALDRLADPAELLDVAQNSDHRDVALRAFDRVVSPGRDLALLRTIESRAQQKAVSKRARGLIQEIEDAEAARRVADEERRRRQAALVDAVERLGETADLSRAHADLAELAAGWRALGEHDEGAAARFDRGLSTAQAAIDRRQREAEDAAELVRLRTEAIATGEALCARLETLDGDDLLEQLTPIEEEWRSLLPLVGDGPEADRLAERFAKAVAACRTRHELHAVLAETRAHLEALVVEAEGLRAHEDASAAAARWEVLSREARGLAATLAAGSRPAEQESPDSAVSRLIDRLKAVGDGFVARDAAERDATLKAQRDLVTRLRQLVERAKRTAEADTVTLREGERLMRDLRAGLDAIARADAATGPSKEIDDAGRALRALQEALAPRVHDLREMDEWRRFANGQQQEQLIAMAEAIVASLKSDEEAGKPADLAATARALRELHTKWQDVADAPRPSAQRLWDRFRGATDFIRSRCENYFAQLREERHTNLQKKTAIVEEAEKLSAATDWGKATVRLQALQAEWPQVGPVPRDAARDLAHRFRLACNLFFARRREDLAARKKQWTDNLGHKEALCQRAEVLAESTDWEVASAEMKRLQSEWKTIGPVRRNHSEAIWARFRTAADRFFDRYHHRHQIAVASKLAEREALVIELEGLATSDATAAAPDLADRVQQLRGTWSRSVPIPAVDMTPLTQRWQAALARVVERWADAFKGTDVDPAVIRERMQKLVARVESLLGDTREGAEGQSQTELLAARLRSALASNAMGGRVSDDSKWRAATDAVKDAQAAWQRLPLLPGQEARALEARFRDVCRRVLDHARRVSGANRRSSKPTAAAM
jgi:hypothetical protein